MLLKELFTTYGSFVTLALLGIGYLIKRVFDLKSKKIEARYAFFQQNKINAIKKFFESYGKAERVWHGFPVQALTEKNFTPKEMDQMIWPVMNEVKMALIELYLYFDESDVKVFENVFDSLLSINRVVMTAYHDDDPARSIDKSWKFQNIKDEVFKANEIVLKQIGAKARIIFDSDKI